MQTLTPGLSSQGGRTSATSSVVVPNAVVATNDSSIVSKRSVEKLYVPDRAGHLLRHFVPKFQRRSPLINRGYWLRMELVKQTVEGFLSSNTGVTKHLVNLGCGFDPLPLHYLRQYPGVDFIDVDYPQSIRRKAEIIQNTPELNGLLIDPQYSVDLDTIMISSANYTAIGTDLRDLCKFDEILRARCQANDETLFISEVAITYMPVEDADSLIKWAAQFPGAKFALIEQILPASEKHPFAKTMLSHFRKIQSALQNIGKYPSLTSQVKRFHTYGWSSVVACDFYGAWCNLVSTEQKSFVESVEAFDEWEDFVSFGQHYFFLYASSIIPDGKHVSLSTREWLGGSRITTQEIVEPDVKSLQNSQGLTLTASLEYRKYWQPGFDRRKFGAAAKLSDGAAIYYGVGGRGNPKSALADCWLFNGSVWARVQDLPNGRYRHSATHISIEGEDRVLVFGGRGNGNEVYNTWVIWSEPNGWSEVTSIGTPPTSRFSASLSWFPSTATGVLTGGFSRDGNIISDILFWSFNSSGSIEHQQWRPLSKFESSLLCRAGAQLIPIGSTEALLVGGMLAHCLSADFPGTFLRLNISNQTIEPLYTILPGKEQDVRPVLMGCAYVWLNNRLHIFGGGITAFRLGV
ncbi:tRNA methyltransferase ppm2, variant 2 [Orbilia oligospora]|nr:tRNA methyltransferase ppm2, variant 2 [Orbilia oligospora]